MMSTLCLTNGLRSTSKCFLYMTFLLSLKVDDCWFRTSTCWETIGQLLRCKEVGHADNYLTRRFIVWVSTVCCNLVVSSFFWYDNIYSMCEEPPKMFKNFKLVARVSVLCWINIFYHNYAIAARVFIRFGIAFYLRQFCVCRWST